MDTKTLVQVYFQNLAQRNLKGVMECFADKVEWNVPGDQKVAPWVGKRTSKAEVESFFKTLWANTVPVDASVDLLIAEGDDAVVTGDFSTRMTQVDKVFTSPFSIRIHFENGLITKYVLMEDGHLLSKCLQP